MRNLFLILICIVITNFSAGYSVQASVIMERTWDIDCDRVTAVKDSAEFGVLVVGNPYQTVRYLISFSPGMHFLASDDDDIRQIKGLGKDKGSLFCFSAGVCEEYCFDRLLSISLGIEYNKTRIDFVSPSKVISPIPEVHTNYLNHLKVQSLDIPIGFRFRNNQNLNTSWYVLCGTGFSYILSAKRDVDLVTTYDYSNEKDVSPVISGKIDLNTKNDFKCGMIGIMGVGKNFEIKNKAVCCAVRFRFDLNKWFYPTYEDPQKDVRSLKRQCLLFDIGFMF